MLKRGKKINTATVSNQSENPGKFCRKYIILALILSLAFALRFIFFYQVAKSPIADMVIEDSKTYHDWALRIAGGDWIGKEVFYALPLYPYWLGLVYTIFGSSLQVAKFIQILIGTVNCLLIYFLGRRLFNPAVGLLAAFFMSIYGWLIVYDSAILSSVLIIFLEALILLYLLRLEKCSTRWYGWLGAGLLIGFSASASAHIIPFIFLVVVWLFLNPLFRARGRRVISLTVYIVGVILALSPITIHNWLVGDDFIPLTAHGGINFFIGNNPHSRGVFEPPPILRSGGTTLQQDAEKIARKSMGRNLKPSEVSAYWFNQGFTFIKEQPGKFIYLLWRKFTIFWDNLEIADVIHPYFFIRVAPILRMPFLVFGVIAPLSLLGLILAWKQRSRICLLYYFVGGYILSVVLYFVNSRYRLPLVPFLMIFSAYSFFWWINAIREKKWIPILFSLLLLLGFIFWVNPQLVANPRFSLNMGAGYNHLGAYFSRKGDLKRALVEFKEALRLEPYRAEAHYNLANIHFRMGSLEEAEKGYQEAIKRNPYYDSAHLALAMIYEQKGEPEKARLKYMEIIQNLPSNTRAYLGLNRLLLRQNRIAEAIRLLEKAISIRPDFPEFYLFLGMAHDREGDRETAIATLERGLEASPDHGAIHLELGRIMSNTPAGRDQGLMHLKRAAMLLPDNYLAHLYLGDAYYNRQDIKKAGQEWLAAYNIKPDDPAVNGRLKTIPGLIK